MKVKTILADLSLLMITIIWGTGFVFTKLVLDNGVSPYMILAYRGLFATIAMTPVMFKHFKTITKKDLLLGFVLGILLFFAFAFQTVGADLTTPSKNAFLTTLNVIFVPFIMMAIFKDRINRFSVFAALIAVAGTALMTLNGQVKDLNLGDILTIICALFWALHVVCTGHFVKQSSVLKLTYLQFIPTFILAFIIGLFFDQGEMMLTAMPFLSILYMSLFGMVIGFGIQTWAMKYSSPQKTSIIFTFEGVFGALFSVLIYRESLSLYSISGGLLIMLAVLISELSSIWIKNKSKLNVKEYGLEV